MKYHSLQDRLAMRQMYEQAVERVNESPQFCSEAARARRDKIKTIFGDKHPEYVEYNTIANLKAEKI